MMAGANLTHIDTWLFDLDNTLYPPEAGLLALVEARILAYFVDLTGLPAAEAWALQKRYLDDYGTATAGLTRHHAVDPHDFLAKAHDVPLDACSRIRPCATPSPVFRDGGWCSPTARPATPNGCWRSSPWPT